MELQEFASSVPRDLVLLAVPRVTIHAGALTFLVGSGYPPRQMLHDIGITAARSGAGVVLQNVLALALSRTSSDSGFESRLAIRMAAATAASTVCRLAIYPGRRTLMSVVISPLIDGVVVGGAYVATHWSDASRFLRDRFPRECDAVAAINAFFAKMSK